MPLFKDLTGSRFGRLLVIARYPDNTKHKKAQFVCRCSCGTEKVIPGADLTSGKVLSCGCYRADLVEATGKFARIHGMTDSAEFKAWRGMKWRCSDQSNPNYGGKGVVVCARWVDSFENFFADMGPKPSPEHSIDRIDPNGNYEPGNCRWATNETQQNNRSNNIYGELDGEKLTAAQIAEKLGMERHTVAKRLKRGVDPREKLYPNREGPIDFEGRKMSVLEISSELGLHPDTVRYRLRNNKSLRAKVNRPGLPARDELKALVEEMPLTKVAERYGVSDVAIGSWCKKLGIATGSHRNRK